MRIILYFFIVFYSLLVSAQDGKPLKVGEEINRMIESTHPYKGSSSTNYELVWSQTIHEENASYIAVHFQKMDLAPDDYLIIRNPENTRTWKYSLGKESRSQFWSIHIYGDEAVIEIFSKSKNGGYGYEIDKIAKGYMHSQIVHNRTGQEALCGPDDTQEAFCYQNSEPFVYDKSRAVARLLINGTSACTGWLIGDDGHLMTNEHCVSNATQANNVTVEFMAEGDTCSTDCRTWLGCGGTIVANSTTLVKSNFNLDYALLKLPTNVSTTYGFLQLRKNGAEQGERIYIPQHPQAWGKRIALNSTHQNDIDGLARVYSINSPRCGGTGKDVGYYADTQSGSSGAPVLGYNDNLVVALHHCGSCPNRGVPIQEIIDDLGSDLPNNALALQPKIIGQETICYSTIGTIFTIQNGESLGWNVSSNLQILSSSNTSITVQSINSSASGAGFIEAVLPTETIRKDIWIGPSNKIGFDVFGNNFHYTPNGLYGTSFIVCPSEYLIISAKPYADDIIEHQWIVTGNYQGSYNSNSTELHITSSALIGATFQISYRSRNSCGWSSWINGSFRNMDCAGGEEPWLVYPNPVSETLSIEKVMHNSYRFTNNKAETRSGFKLFNFDGVLVLEGAISDSITNIDVSKLRKGQYILKIHQDGYENTQHIIIN